MIGSAGQPCARFTAYACGSGTGRKLWTPAKSRLTSETCPACVLTNLTHATTHPSTDFNGGFDALFRVNSEKSAAAAAAAAAQRALPVVRRVSFTEPLEVFVATYSVSEYDRRRTPLGPGETLVCRVLASTRFCFVLA